MTAPQVVELDMGFSVAEVRDGIARLIRNRGGDGAPVAEGAGCRFTGPDGVTIEVGPMPPERISYPQIFFPRTLLVIRGGGVAVEALRKEVLLAFLRVGG